MTSPTVSSAAVSSSDRYTLVFDSLACEIGLEEAVFVSKLAIFIRSKIDLGEVDEHGIAWVHNTREAWVEKVFPFWTARVIARIESSLIANKIIKIERRGGYDRRGYYAFTDQDYWVARSLNRDSPISPNGQMDLPKRSNGFAQTVKCTINHINTHTDSHRERNAAEPPSSFFEQGLVKVEEETGCQNLAQEWLDHTQDNRPQLDAHQTLEMYEKVIRGSCNHMGWQPETLRECFRMMKGDSFWGPHLIDPFGLMKKWDGGRKIEKLSDQCKNHKKMKRKKDDYELDQVLKNMAGFKEVGGF